MSEDRSRSPASAIAQLVDHGEPLFGNTLGDAVVSFSMLVPVTTKTLVAVLALASATAQAQPGWPEQGWRDAKENKPPPPAYLECMNCTSTQFSYWTAYGRAVLRQDKGFMGR